MPKKKSIKKSAQRFTRNANAIVQFTENASAKLSQQQVSWAYDYAIIRLYREFENLMLDALVGAVNNDTSTLSTKTGFAFPRHLTDEVCAFLVVGNGYFDFRGRDGLIKRLKDFVPDNHYLVDVVKQQKYTNALNVLASLRNFAAHASRFAKKKALEALNVQRLESSGAWLKRQNRFEDLTSKIIELARDIENRAPY
jgi:cupin superfamily acireductone dioxygenase involved in methionine salvage